MAQPVIFITGSDPLTHKGGYPSFVRVHARAAQRAGFEPHLFCVAARSGTVSTDFGVVHRTASPFRLISQMTVPVHAPLLTAAIEHFWQGRAEPLLVHGFSLWGYVGVRLRRRLRRQRCQVVLLVSVFTTIQHETEAKLWGLTKAHGGRQRLRHQVELAWCQLALNRYERRTLTESRLVLINYDSVARICAAQYGAGLNFRKLPYSVEPAFLPLPAATPRASSAAPLIVSVSRHDARKGIDVLLHALARLRQAGVPFRACVVSGGPLFAAHQRLTAQLVLDDVVTLTDWVADPFVYLQQADVFVLPSLEEGSGSLSLIEALQAGAAIVASDIDGIPEDVTDGESALLVAPGDVAALTGALTRVLSDEALRAQLQRRARATFAEKFSATALTEALRQTYAELGFAGSATI